MKGLLHEGLDIHIRNGATVKLQDHNWVPCLRGRGPKLKDPTSNGHLWVKDLTYTDTDQWDEAKIRELVEAEDCQAILDIQSLNPHTMDKWCWKMGVKGKFSVASSYKTGSRRRIQQRILGSKFFVPQRMAVAWVELSISSMFVNLQKEDFHK
ncbi:ribonuclease H-like superfamily protein [Striga asiatica]|uniref:Ribonuclease H-like superfamily protein n=1 Tax=Striga asiatica TaxID=4170 RepID=A0A5A7QQC7_STRAF|nr:ribonuclease H-like superfamily protein [Striga asiatica]